MTCTSNVYHEKSIRFRDNDFITRHQPTFHVWLCAESVLSLGVCENRDGWLVAWGLCGCMLIRFSAVWLLPFTLFPPGN